MSRTSQSLPINDMYRAMYLMPIGSARYLNNDRQSLSGSGILQLIPRELPRFFSQPTGYFHPEYICHNNLGHALPYPIPCQSVPLVSPCKNFEIFPDVYKYEHPELEVKFVDRFKIINDKYAERKDNVPMNLPRFSSQPTGYFHPEYICHNNLGHALPYPIPCQSVPLVSPSKDFKIFPDVHEYEHPELEVKFIDRFKIINDKYAERKDDVPMNLPRFSSQPTGYFHPEYICHNNLGHALPYPIPCQSVPLVSPSKNFKIFPDVHKYEHPELEVKFIDRFKIINDKYAERKDDVPMNLPRFSSQPTCYFHPEHICHDNLGHALSYPIPCQTMTLVSPKKDFKICLDVHEYGPEELKVKCVDDFIIIEGEHPEKMDHVSLVSQQFTRRFEIPKDIDKESINCTFSLDGILSIFGQKVLKERKIPIITVNRPSTSKLGNAKVPKRISLQGMKDQSQRRQTPQDSTNTKAVEEPVSPQLEEDPEIMERAEPEKSAD